jgi:hypothetical protein
MWEEGAIALQQIMPDHHCCMIMVLSAVIGILIYQGLHAGMSLLLGRS